MLSRNFQKSLIKAIERHVETGYYAGDEATKAQLIIDAIRAGNIQMYYEQDNVLSFEQYIEHMELTAEDRRKLRRRYNSSGLFTATAQYWKGRSWESHENMVSNTCGGFMGSDLLGSGYELQLMEEAIDAYSRQPLDSHGYVIDPFRRAA